APHVAEADWGAGARQLDLQEPGDERVVVDDEQLLAARLGPRLDVAHRTPIPAPVRLGPPAPARTPPRRADLHRRIPLEGSSAGTVRQLTVLPPRARASSTCSLPRVAR